MSTNFFWRFPHPNPVILPTGESITVDIDMLDPAIHISKRSAAGLYCWDCRRTLCREGERYIHYSQLGHWYKSCPECGQEPATESLDSSSVGVELGFAQPERTRPHGVRSCASMSWAQDPLRVRQTCRERLNESVIEDEYGRFYTGDEFLSLIETSCPIEFTDSVGCWFG